MDSSKRYVLVSTDGHCGAGVLDYKPYLDRTYHDDFDVWAASYEDAWGELDMADDDYRMGIASFACDVNWDSAKRNRYIEREGITAEVLFPNTAPPFFPAGLLGAHPPASAREYEFRFAGLKAHNRWLVDFCNDLPGRRCGVAQIFLNEIDDTLNEIRWAKEQGLRGITLPPDHMLQLSNLYYPRFDPVWQLLEELELPVHRHGTVPSEVASEENGVAGPAIGLSEVDFFSTRPIRHMILSGVFDRFPKLKLVITEYRPSLVLPLLAQLDVFVTYSRTRGTIGDVFGGDAMRSLKQLPSEYLKTNIYNAGFFDGADIRSRHNLGVDRMMWGADFPHHEGTSPFTREALRLNFAGMPGDEVRRMTSLNAIDVYGLDEVQLQKVADRIGPTPAEIAEPLTAVPQEASTFCPTFGDTFGMMVDA